MRYIKADLLMPLEIYTDLNNYMKDNVSVFKPYINTIIVKEYTIVLNLTQHIKKDSMSKKLKINIIITKNLDLVKSYCTYTDCFTDIISVFNIFSSAENLSFLIKIDRFKNNSFYLVKNDINLLQLKTDDGEYVKNVFLHSNFSDEKELMETCYLILANHDIIRHDLIFKKDVENKLNYYGYAKESDDWCHLTVFNDSNMKTSTQILKLIVNRMFYDIERFDSSGQVIHGFFEPLIEIEETALKVYMKYVDCLYSEGKLTSYIS